MSREERNEIAQQLGVKSDLVRKPVFVKSLAANINLLDNDESI
jgi:hypothetical protein